MAFWWLLPKWSQYRSMWKIWSDRLRSDQSNIISYCRSASNWHGSRLFSFWGADQNASSNSMFINHLTADQPTVIANFPNQEEWDVFSTLEMHITWRWFHISYCDYHITKKNLSRLETATRHARSLEDFGRRDERHRSWNIGHSPSQPHVTTTDPAHPKTKEEKSFVLRRRARIHIPMHTTRCSIWS